LVGSPFLYGEKTLKQVALFASLIAKGLNDSAEIPCRVVYKETMKEGEEIEKWVNEANHDDSCAGIITWRHTFSPSKMWLMDSSSFKNTPFLETTQQRV
jgi:L-arabinose isomerase